MLARHIFEQDLLPAVLPHISVQLAETWIGSSPCWWTSCCCPTCVAGLLMGPVCKAVVCLSFWHSLHLTTAGQFLARWLIEARQRKQILCCVSRAFCSATDLDLKARHLPRGWHSLWRTHHLAGSVELSPWVQSPRLQSLVQSVLVQRSGHWSVQQGAQ